MKTVLREGKEMGLEVGTVVEARVTGITKFGAFAALPEGKSGLVHISEIASGYVNDVAEHLSIGQTVKVLILSIAPDGKINLSIKRAESRTAPKTQSGPRTERPARQESQPRQTASPQMVNTNSGNEDFEDRLKRFMRESDSRIADNRMYSEHRQRSRRR